jgi:hypothetical protein
VQRFADLPVVVSAMAEPYSPRDLGDGGQFKMFVGIFRVPQKIAGQIVLVHPLHDDENDPGLFVIQA